MDVVKIDYLGIKGLEVINTASNSVVPGRLRYKGECFPNEEKFLSYMLDTLVDYGCINFQDFQNRGIVVLEEYSKAYPGVARNLLENFIVFKSLCRASRSFGREVVQEAKDLSKSVNGKHVFEQEEVR